jgi:hypothetical protein
MSQVQVSIPEGYKFNELSKRLIKIGGKTDKSLSGQKSEKDTSDKVFNPETKRWVKIGSKTHNKMMGVTSSTKYDENWVKNEKTNRMVKIGSKTHLKLTNDSEKILKDPSVWTINPDTKRYMKINGKTHLKILSQKSLEEAEVKVEATESSEISKEIDNE